jgi:hypothetical protein
MGANGGWGAASFGEAFFSRRPSCGPAAARVMLSDVEPVPPEIRASDVLAALPGWGDDESALLGVFESGELEFKRAPYGLDNDGSKAEFAKDVAGMANAGGGLIVLGIETQSDPALGRDRSTAVRPLSMGSCNAQQMEDIARTWVYPPQRGLRVKEWPNKAGDAMLVSVEVPPSPEMGGLAIVLGPGDPPDRKTIGVPVRSASRVDWHSAPEIYEWIRRGRLISAAGAEPEPGPANAEPKLEADAQLERIRVEVVAAAPTGHAVFFLQAWPTVAVRLDKMFDFDGPRFLFSNPPPHRAEGFNWWGLTPELDTSQGLRASMGPRLSLWITPGAVMTLAVGEEYLTWSMQRYAMEMDKPLVNPFVVAEFTYEFCRTYLLIRPMCTPIPTHATFRTGVLQALHPNALYLASGKPRTFFPNELHSAPSDELIDQTDPLKISEGGYSAEGICVFVLRRFYALFGLGRESIPFLKDDGQRFDPESLSAT